MTLPDFTQGKAAATHRPMPAYQKYVDHQLTDRQRLRHVGLLPHTRTKLEALPSTKGTTKDPWHQRVTSKLSLQTSVTAKVARDSIEVSDGALLPNTGGPRRPVRIPQSRPLQYHYHLECARWCPQNFVLTPLSDTRSTLDSKQFQPHGWPRHAARSKDFLT